MQVVCRFCEKQYSLRDENVGDYFRCRACGKLSPVSRSDAQPAKPPPSSPRVARPAAPTASPAAGGGNLAGVATPADSSEVRWDISCQQCGRRHNLRAELAGKQFRCKGCGTPNRIAPPDAATGEEEEEVLVAVPIAAVSSLPTAQVVFDDDEGYLSPIEDPLAGQRAAPLSTIRLAAPVAKPIVAAPKKKKKKNRKNPLRRFMASAVLGSLKGLFALTCALLGLAIVGWALYSLVGQDDRFWGRKTFRALILGGAFVGTGIRWLLSQPFSDD